MEKRVGKREIIILVVLFAVIFLIWFGYHRLHSRDSGSRIRITVSGETIGEYDLGVDREIPIDSGGRITNTLVISGGEAQMISADCPDQICVNAAPISALKETIVCLPNRIVVEVVSSDEEPEFDVIVQ